MFVVISMAVIAVMMLMLVGVTVVAMVMGVLVCVSIVTVMVLVLVRVAVGAVMMRVFVRVLVTRKRGRGSQAHRQGHEESKKKSVSDACHILRDLGVLEKRESRRIVNFRCRC